MNLDIIVKKAEDFFKWLDSVPSVPAAIGGLVVGAFIPLKFITVFIIVFGVYIAIKVNSLRD